ncbi:uncharacterized protein LOC132624202 [Lycium barbarum]|uniref:uncharacterized protein LOC132624202 n=1 Tax=Lycium barbarum TaxID=112863 RepID=UPI00293EC157|nr:uncharacterized protein LOC132624202 [Lycium barbarum]
MPVRSRWRRRLGSGGGVELYSSPEKTGFTQKGSPFKNSRRPRTNLGRRGGLEIVFNQQ